MEAKQYNYPFTRTGMIRAYARYIYPVHEEMTEARQDCIDKHLRQQGDERAPITAKTFEITLSDGAGEFMLIGYRNAEDPGLLQHLAIVDNYSMHTILSNRFFQ